MSEKTYNTIITRPPNGIVATALVVEDLEKDVVPRKVNFVSRDGGKTWKRLGK